jgi:hypothetical protein
MKLIILRVLYFFEYISCIELNKSKWHVSAYWREIWKKCDIFIFPMLIWFTMICLKVNEIQHFKGVIFLWIHKPDKLNKSKWHLFAYWREIWEKCDIFIFPMLIWLTVIYFKLNEIDHFRGIQNACQSVVMSLILVILSVYNENFLLISICTHEKLWTFMKLLSLIYILWEHN